MSHPTLAPDAVGAYTPPAADAAPAVSADAPWPPALRVAFRFAFAWLVLVIGVGPLGAIPGVDALAGLAHESWAPVLRWVGDHVLHTAAPAVDHPNGAGDKTIFWVSHVCDLVLALVAAALWTALDRRRPHYRTLHDRLRVWVRYTLGVSMLGYGAFKIIKLQFPDPALASLVQPYGSFSPMAVLWRMMGRSYGYNLFTGVAEAVPALLLFWRRTTTLGALGLAAALANVVALNLTYDVTVKGYSILLLLMAVFLLLPEARRLASAVVLGRAVPAAGAGVPYPARWRVPRLALKGVLVAWIVGSTFYGAWEAWRASAAPGTEPPLYGIYEVDAFALNGAERPPLTTDPVRWRRLVIDRRATGSVQAMSDSLRRYRVKVDTAARTIALATPTPNAPFAEGTPWATLRYVPVGAGRLAATGVAGGDSLRLTLRRLDHTRFFLLARGREFRWVQDDNVNR